MFCHRPLEEEISESPVYIGWEDLEYLESPEDALSWIDIEEEEEVSLDSILRKRKRKMNKHRHRKRMRAQKFLRRKLGK